MNTIVYTIAYTTAYSSSSSYSHIVHPPPEHTDEEGINCISTTEFRSAK